MNPKFLLSAFVVGILTSIYGVWALSERANSIFEPRSTQAAAYSREFLVTATGSHFMRYRKDVLDDAETFKFLFPGYPPDMAKDRNLWKNYFSREFETKTASSYLAGENPYGMSVHLSFTGCMDILRRYGADVLIVGASDVAQAIPPDELGLYFPKKRVLMCASPSLTIDAVNDFVKTISEYKKIRGEGIETILFGLSTTLAFTPSLYYPAINQAKLGLIEEYRKSTFLGRFSYLNRRRTIPWTWNEWIPSRKNVRHLPLPNQNARKKDLDNPERWSIFSFDVSRRELQDDERINELRKQYPQVSYVFSGNEDPDCRRVSHFGDTLREIRERSVQISKKMIFFYTPTMGDELQSAPACFLPYLTEQMKALNGDMTLGIYLDAKAFALDARDYAFVERSWKPDEIRIDMGHLNIRGARRFTAEIAQMIKERF